MVLVDFKIMKVMVEFWEYIGKFIMSSLEVCCFCGFRSGIELFVVGSVCFDVDC